MMFSLPAWWHRRRIRAEMAYAGRPVHNHRVTNPYHAVSIKAGQACPQTALKYGNRRYLSAEAPPLPTPVCSPTGCKCGYVHHEDRRALPDRRHQDVWNPNAQPGRSGDRRRSLGRRLTDH